MKKTTSTAKMTSQLASAPAIQAPQLPREFEEIRKRAERLYAARNGMIGFTLNDWRQAEQELKSKSAKPGAHK